MNGRFAPKAALGALSPESRLNLEIEAWPKSAKNGLTQFVLMED
jgi:hypothetical protein